MMAPFVAGHALIISVQGLVDGKQAGPVGQAIGYDRSVPLNGDLRHVPIFNQRGIATWNGCGQNILTGTLLAAKVAQAQVGRGEIAQALAGGQVFMVLHQVNGDGNGPFICGIDAAATAARGSFKKLEIAKQVPGANPELNAVATTNHPLIINLPADLECTGTFGTKENICLIRCQNFAINGPFGSCAAIQIVTELKSLYKRDADGEDASVKVKRQEEAGPEKKDPEVGKGASDADIAKLMSRFDTTTKKAKRQEEVEPEKKDPEVGKGASDADIAKLMSNFDTSTKMVKRAATTEAEKVEDTVKALTEGDDVPKKQLEKLRAQVKQRLRNGTLASKAEKAGKKYHEKKVRLRKAGSWKSKKPSDQKKPAAKKNN